MQIMHEQLDYSGDNTIKVKWDQFAHFTFPWHYHKELEIVYVITSYGFRYLGDTVKEFHDGDLVLVGSNLPHYWKNHDDFHKGDVTKEVKAIIIQFPPSIIEKMDYPEFGNIQKLLVRSERGIQFKNSIVKVLKKKLHALLKADSLQRYMKLMKVLEIMATTDDYDYVCGPNIKHTLPSIMDSRLERVMLYLNKNFTEDHNMTKLCDLVGMSETSFCRYFKSKTNKTIVEYLHDIRIGYACKLLIEKKNSISEIAFQCGFNSVSNFNRIFKRKTKYTPSNYIKKMVNDNL